MVNLIARLDDGWFIKKRLDDGWTHAPLSSEWYPTLHTQE